MKTVIIVSKCIRVTKFDFNHGCYEFHFKGVCSGEILRKVILKGKYDFQIKKNEEYLLYVQLESFERGVLKGSIIKVRLLDECFDRS